MEPGELKVKKKPNHLKRRKTRVNKSRLILVWNFFCLESGAQPLRTKHREKKTKTTPDNSRQNKTALTLLMILFKCRVRAFFLISYLFLLVERAVFKFPPEMIGNPIKLKQPTRRS